jgi:hypothetical protein
VSPFAATSGEDVVVEGEGMETELETLQEGEDMETELETLLSHLASIPAPVTLTALDPARETVCVCVCVGVCVCV